MPKLSLRSKILISLTIFVLAFLLIAIFISEKIFLGSFSALENKEAIKSIERSKIVFDRQVFTLDARLNDWSTWNDTYYFIKNKNQAYIDSNLTDESLGSLGINAMFFIDPSGEVVYEKQINIDVNQSVSVINDLKITLLKSKNIISFSDTKDKHSGIARGLSGHIFFASRPILKSDATGSIAGTLIFIRYFDRELKDYFEKINNNNKIEILDYNSTTLGKYAKVKEQLSLGKQYYMFPLSSDRIGSFTLIYDYNNKPAFILENELPRDIYKQGFASVLNFLYFVTFLSISGISFTLFLLNKFVVSKIEKLNKDVGLISDLNSPKNKLDVIGNDEFTNLALNINKMFDDIATSGETLKKADEELKREKANLDQKIAELESINSVMVGRELEMIELKKEIEELKNKGSEEK